tara:strand:+ start:6429 stop:6689 length:261 start_codon:yes stop_codon:yes gene_type:complete
MKKAIRKEKTRDVNLGYPIFILVRGDDIPVTDMARRMAKITGDRVDDIEDVNVFYHGQNLMAKRGYELDGMMANDDAVVYAGVKAI